MLSATTANRQMLYLLQPRQPLQAGQNGIGIDGQGLAYIFQCLEASEIKQLSIILDCKIAMDFSDTR